MSFTGHDKHWLRFSVFTWGNPNDQVGQTFAIGAYNTAVIALEQGRGSAEPHYAHLATSYQYAAPFVHPYMAELLQILRRILDTGSLPPRIFKASDENSIGRVVGVIRPGHHSSGRVPGKPIIEIDKRWLREEVFVWKADHAPGRAFAANLVNAVTQAIETGDLYQAELSYERARRAPHFMNPGFNAYINRLVAIARDMMNRRALPSKITRHQNEASSVLVEVERPVPVAPKAVTAFSGLVDELVKTKASAYAESRKEELAAARSALEGGQIDIDKAPELAAKAMEARAEVVAEDKAAKAEVSDLESKRNAAQRRRDVEAAKVASIKGGPEQIEGISKTFKKIKKQVKRSWGDAIDPLEDMRDWISHNVLPAAVQDLGRKIDKERKKFGRRIDKELQRGIKNVAIHAPWLHLVAPFLGIIPVVGWLFQIIFVATIATAEITFTIKQKKAIGRALRQARNILLAEIAALDAEAEELRKLAAELEAERLRVLALAEGERAARLARLSVVEAERAAARRSVIVGAAVSTGATVAIAAAAPKDHRMKVYALGALGVVVVGSRALQKALDRVEEFGNERSSQVASVPVNEEPSDGQEAKP